MAIFLSSNEKETRGTVGKAVSGEEFADFILQSMLDMWQNGWKKIRVTVQWNESHDDQNCQPFPQPTQYWITINNTFVLVWLYDLKLDHQNRCSNKQHIKKEHQKIKQLRWMIIY